MQVRRAIELLQNLDPDSHVIMAWWEHDMFSEVPKERWAEFADSVEDRMDWSVTHDALYVTGELAIPDLYSGQEEEDDAED